MNKLIIIFLILLAIIIGELGLLGYWLLTDSKEDEPLDYFEDESFINTEEPINNSIDDYPTQDEDIVDEDIKNEEIDIQIEEDKTEIVDDGDTDISIIEKLVTWGHRESSGYRDIDVIIIHSAYDALGTEPHSVDGVIEEFRIYGVSSHYLVDREGEIYQLVLDNDVAYHAGSGKLPDGRTSINEFSIGIELIYKDTESPNEEQYIALANLAHILQTDYDINEEDIFTHQTIAPTRKTDPWNFDRDKFITILKEISE